MESFTRFFSDTKVCAVSDNEGFKGWFSVKDIVDALRHISSIYHQKPILKVEKH